MKFLIKLYFNNSPKRVLLSVPKSSLQEHQDNQLQQPQAPASMQLDEVKPDPLHVSRSLRFKSKTPKGTKSDTRDVFLDLCEKAKHCFKLDALLDE